MPIGMLKFGREDDPWSIATTHTQTHTHTRAHDFCFCVILTGAVGQVRQQGQICRANGGREVHEDTERALQGDQGGRH